MLPMRGAVNLDTVMGLICGSSGALSGIYWGDRFGCAAQIGVAFAGGIAGFVLGMVSWSAVDELGNYSNRARAGSVRRIFLTGLYLLLLLLWVAAFCIGPLLLLAHLKRAGHAS
jgi:hypothetical protein